MKQSIFSLLALLSLLMACSESSEQTIEEVQTESDLPQFSMIPKEESLKRTRDSLHKIYLADSLQQQAESVRINHHIDSIRKEFYRIEGSLAEVEYVQFELTEEEQPPYGGQFEAWRKAGEWIKIRETPYNEHGIIHEDYYFHDGEVFFVFSYREFIPMFEKPPSEVSETRLYLADGELVQILEKEKSFEYGEAINMSSVPNQAGSIDNPKESFTEIQERGNHIQTVVEEYIDNK